MYVAYMSAREPHSLCGGIRSLDFRRLSAGYFNRSRPQDQAGIAQIASTCPGSARPCRSERRMLESSVLSSDSRESPHFQYNRSTMSKTYDHEALESKWQAYWETHRPFRAMDDPAKPKFYCLDMFPYPSGSGLHVGHLEGYTATDIVSRYKRMRGFNVLHPMGWDAFGLPAEQYAVKTGVHPAITTAQNIATFKRQMKRVGLSYDWDRELSTTDQDYYRWTQWIFLKLFERGLAYVAEVPVNWCPALATVLANEEIVDGKSEVGGFDVIRKPMKQWVLKITAYAERLLDDLKLVEWPASTLEMQKNWIGRSIGAEVDFPLADATGNLRDVHDPSRYTVRRHLHGFGA